MIPERAPPRWITRPANAGVVALLSLVLIAGMVAAGSAYNITINATIHGYAAETSPNAIWATIRDGAGDTSASTQAIIYAPQIVATSTSDQYDYLRRAIYSFNTSILGGSANISLARLVLYGDTNTNNNFASPPDIGITQHTLANNLAIANGDYAAITVNEFAPRKTYAEWNNNGFNNFTFTSSGIALISKTSFTVISARLSWDIDNNTPTWANGAYTTFAHTGGGGVNSPSLYIEYTLDTTPAASFTKNQTTGTAPLAVNFTDTSTNSPTSGNYTATCLQNSSIIQIGSALNLDFLFTEGGKNWSINHTATNAVGSDTTKTAAWVNVSSPIVVPLPEYYLISTTDFPHTQAIHINNTANSHTLSRYPVFLNITYNATMQADFDDIRVVNASNYIMPHYLESKANGAFANIWFYTESLPASSWINTTYSLRWGKSDAWTATNGYGTFYGIFDNFDSYNRSPSNPILSPDSGLYATWGSVWKNGSTYHLYYSSTDNSTNYNIGHATSSDGITWVKDTVGPAVSNGTPGTWDDTSLWCPNVWQENGIWYMIYTGFNGATHQGGLATSVDGVTWVKSGSNPVITGTEVEVWGVIKIGSTYYAWYGNTGAPERKLNLATSTDLITWVKDPRNPIFSGNMFCGNVFKYGNFYYMLIPQYLKGSDYSFFTLYRDTDPTFPPETRSLLRIAKTISPSYAWENLDEDTPYIFTFGINRTLLNLDDPLWVYYGGDSSKWRLGLLTEYNLFDALAIGSYIRRTNWSDTPASGAASEYNMTLYKDGNSALRIYDTSGSNEEQFKTGMISRTNGTVGIWMRTGGTTNDGAAKVNLSALTTTQVSFGMNETTRKFFYYNGTQYDTAVDYTADTWYYLKLDFTTAKINLTIFDIALVKQGSADNIAATISSVDNVTLQTDAAFNGNAYYDGLRVYDFTYPIPVGIWESGNSIPPVSSFLMDGGAGSITDTAPVAVNFDDTSTGVPTTWNWTCTNVTPGNNTKLSFSTVEEPVFVFQHPGNYSIQLNVSNAFGYNESPPNTRWVNATPTGGPPPTPPPVSTNLTANFAANITEGMVTLHVNFTDLSTNGSVIIDTWNWSFGTGTLANGSDMQNPTFNYSAVGEYRVQLLIRNFTYGDSAVLTRDHYIRVFPFQVNQSPRYYWAEDTFIPFWLWAVIIGFGVLFLIVAVLGGVMVPVFGLLSFGCFLFTAVASPIVGFFDYKMIPVTTSGSTAYYMQPIVHQVTQPWVAWLLYGFAMIGLLVTVAGIVANMQRTAQQKAIDDDDLGI